MMTVHNDMICRYSSAPSIRHLSVSWRVLLEENEGVQFPKNPKCRFHGMEGSSFFLKQKIKMIRFICRSPKSLKQGFRGNIVFFGIEPQDNTLEFPWLLHTDASNIRDRQSINSVHGCLKVVKIHYSQLVGSWWHISVHLLVPRPLTPPHEAVLLSDLHCTHHW